MHLPAPKGHNGTQSFLRSEPESALHIEADGAPDKQRFKKPEQVTVFPGPLISTDVAARLNAWENFIALAVRIDPPGNEAAPQALRPMMETRLNEIIQAKQGLWFEWDSGLYGCALPGGQAAEAVELARQLQEALAQQVDETLSIGVTHFPLLDFDRAATLQNGCKALDHAAFFGPGSVVTFDAVSLNICGDHYYQNGRLEEALKEYQTALRLDPSNVNVRNSLGVCLARMEDRPGARAAFTEVMHWAPNEPMAIYNLGVLDLLEQMPGEALARFRHSQSINPGIFEVNFQIGKLLAEKNAHAEARPYLAAAIQLNPAHALAHTLLGQCLSVAGQNPEAISAYKKAVKLNPNDAAALSALGTLYDEKGENPGICLTFCRQSVTLCPDNGLYRWRLARLYQKQNQLEAALAEYEAATALGHDASPQLTELRDILGKSAGKKKCCA
jgi:tetratricopeptide (TPR) repeat protein